MELSVQQIVLILGVWVLLAVLGKPLHELLRVLSRLFASFLKSVTDALGEAIPSLPIASRAIQDYVRRFWGAVESLLGRIEPAIASLADVLQVHSSHVLNLLPASPKPRGLQAFGYLLYLMAFLAFAFADVAQATNSRSVMYVGLAVPGFLQDLTIPLLIASGGTAIILGTIMGDLLAKTDLVPWSVLPRWARGLVGALAFSTFLFTLVLMVLIALVRVTEITHIVLAESVAQQLRTLAAFADSLVIIPLLITTFLLFWGLFGLLVVYFVAVWMLVLALKLLGFVVSLLRSASTMLANGSAALVAMLFGLLQATLAVLKWMLEMLNTVLEHTIALLEAALDLAIYPLVEMANEVNRYFREEGS